jgi:hypothetical protein
VAAEAGWVLVPAEVAEQAAVVPQVGAAAPAAREVCGRRVSQAQQVAVGRVVARVEEEPA